MESQNPLVSIIVPSFQQGAYLRDCIGSIVSQEGVAVEILVFDSESTDNSPHILKEFEGLVRITIERDLGQAHAVNKGLRQSKGDIVGFLNSDDILLPGSLQRVVEYWVRNPKTDLLYGKARYIDQEGEVIGEYRTREWDWDKFQGECFICQPAAFWSRRIMEGIGKLDQSLTCSMDYDYWLRIGQAGGRVAYLDEYLACSRDYPQTKTRNLRGTVFIENFRLSLKRLGYVHGFWISQYLDYFKYETKPIWAQIIPAPGRARNSLSQLLQAFSRLWARDVQIVESPKRRVL